MVRLFPGITGFLKEDGVCVCVCVCVCVYMYELRLIIC
jgi:hypothetical protein